MFAGALACIAMAGCGRSSRNEVCDSEMRSVAQCWTFGGSMIVRPGLGPNSANIVYDAGTGRPSGARWTAKPFCDAIRDAKVNGTTVAEADVGAMLTD